MVAGTGAEVNMVAVVVVVVVASAVVMAPILYYL